MCHVGSRTGSIWWDYDMIMMDYGPISVAEGFSRHFTSVLVSPRGSQRHMMPLKGARTAAEASPSSSCGVAPRFSTWLSVMNSVTYCVNIFVNFR